MLANVGVPGAMLIWFATRMETRIKSIESGSNRQTRAMLLLVISLRSANDETKTQARAILREVDQAEGQKVDGDL